MKRKTGLKRRKPLRKTPLHKVSSKQKDRLSRYYKIQREFLRENTVCAVCWMVERVVRLATEVHHARGRNGKLLFDTRYFIASCRGHRMWPHDNPKRARGLGLLAHAKDWGSTR